MFLANPLLCTLDPAGIDLIQDIVISSDQPLISTTVAPEIEPSREIVPQTHTGRIFRVSVIPARRICLVTPDILHVLVNIEIDPARRLPRHLGEGTDIFRKRHMVQRSLQLHAIALVLGMVEEILDEDATVVYGRERDRAVGERRAPDRLAVLDARREDGRPPNRHLDVGACREHGAAHTRVYDGIFVLREDEFGDPAFGVVVSAPEFRPEAGFLVPVVYVAVHVELDAFFES